MAILRAGPFSDRNSHFLYTQSDLANNAAPVNCANYTNSEVWPWRYKKNVTKDTISHTGCEINPGSGETVPVLVESSDSNLNVLETVDGNFSISDSISSNNETAIILTFSFFYQATHSFQIQVDFTASAVNAAFQTNPQLFIDSQMTSPIETWPNLSGSVTRTLEATVIPAIYSIEINAAGGINVASDPCVPSTTTVTSAVSLDFKFL
tara:strand:+ start:95 stop:718 length:624 start_codon:yes stop_codon:yes gene_type:complete